MDHTVDVFALLHCQGLRRPRRFANLSPNLDHEVHASVIFDESPEIYGSLGPDRLRGSQSRTPWDSRGFGVGHRRTAPRSDLDE